MELESLARDLRFVVRGLRRTPGFAIAAVLTLGLGIGATTAVFSVVYGAVFRPLPFPNADRLVQVVQLIRYTDVPDVSRRGLSPEQIWALQKSRTLTQIGYAIPFAFPATLTGVPTPVRLAGVGVSASLFDTLGVRPMLGRVYAEEEAGAILISHDTWRRYFGSDPGIVGSTVTLNTGRLRIVGVMPEGFGFPSIAQAGALASTGEAADGPEFWRPLALRPTRGGSIMMPTPYALLREGVTVAQAAAELAGLLPPLPPRVQQAGLDVVSLRDETARRARPVLLTFQAAVGLVLLIACLNIVNLLRSRATRRSHELWIRLALGASRAGMLRYVMMESLVLATAGGAIAAGFAYLLTAALRWLPPHVLPRLADVYVDGRILAFAFLVSAAAGATVGILSSARITSLSPRSARTVVPGRPSDALVISEVAAAVVLLVAGGLLLNSSVRLARVPLGIEPEGVLTFGVSVPLPGYPTRVAQEALYTRLTEAWRQVPGVTSVAMGTDGNVLGPSSIGWPIVIRGRTFEQTAEFRHVSPGFFTTLGIQLRHGREFSDADSGESPRTIVVSEGFARKYFGAVNVVGERIGFEKWSNLEIVGVAADTRATPDAAVEPTIYLPEHAIVGLAGVVGAVRTSGDPRAVAPEIRRIVREADPSLVVYDIQTVDEMVARSTVTSRFYAAVSAGFALLAAILAAVGLYGVLAYSVAARTREFGIRTAVGAAPRQLLAAVMGRGLAMTLAGILTGLVGAWFASRLLQKLLFGVTPADPATFAGVTILFLMIGTVACLFPARRATRIDPVVALRAE